MAGVDYEEFNAQTAPPAGGAMQRVTAWAGALTSVALVAGLTVWGYRLAVRDVTGVPVVRALEGPMRMAPEDPGGQQAQYQGLAVNRVTSEGEAAPPADRLLLAPRPVGLSAEDAPRAELRPMPRAAEAAPETVQNAYASPEIAAPDPVAAALALVDKVTAGQKPFGPVAPPTAPEVEAAPAVAAVAGGLARSPRPVLRPAQDPVALAAMASVANTKSAPVQDLASVTAGTNLVQLGAYGSEDVARAEWQRLSARFASLMEGKQRLVQSAVSGGRTFYRLRAVGFADVSDARRFCAALTAEKADCIPVVAR